jgi:phosphohistidine phosphatase SixA
VPTQILIMRHAEKPDDPTDPDLTAAGMNRANMLAAYIPRTFGTPNFIFAASVSKNSARPFETVEPLSKAIGVPIDTTFADQDYGALAKTVRDDQKFVDRLTVMCWHHGNIPNMLHALQVPDGQYPDPWDREVFNLILKVTLESNTAPTITQTSEPF